MEKWRDSLFQEVDSASLVFFRISFGLLMLWEVSRYFSHDWIRRYWINPSFLFGYEGFEWIRVWAGNGMYVHFMILGILAFCIAIGLAYRWSMSLFFVGFTYVFLLDKSYYLNHFYLISLLSGLMIFLPLHRRFAIDAHTGLSSQSNTVPAWTLFLLRAQLAIVYFFGGIAKINPDWLNGQPIGKWLAASIDFPLIGSYFTEHWVVMLFAYGGLMLDLLAAPLLFWRKTRPYAFFVVLLFHLTNARLFSIGVFPWFMIAATTLFFEPDWCRRIIPRMKETVEKYRVMVGNRLVLSLLGVFLLIQVLLPLRHFLYPGDVHWTEEGHRFSWHMKLRSKSGEANFRVVDPASRQTWDIQPQKFLSKRQVSKMVGRPDMILQFSHYLSRYYAYHGYPGVEVYVESYASLNGHKPRRELVKGHVNLAAIRPSLGHATWIWPSREAAPPRPSPVGRENLLSGPPRQ